MKISVLFLFVASANTFQIQPTRVAQSRTAHKMSWFDFKPIHGAGSGSQRDLEEQYKMQQELLKARRDHINFNSLHSKYSKEDKGHQTDVFALGKDYQQDKYAESYVDEKDTPAAAVTQKKFRFPWDLKP
eukprot:scaffold4843_cov266-Chaetoceros_neogracile.AAC.6